VTADADTDADLWDRLRSRDREALGVLFDPDRRLRPTPPDAARFAGPTQWSATVAASFTSVQVVYQPFAKLCQG
jgi:hypothetical protein